MKILVGVHAPVVAKDNGYRIRVHNLYSYLASMHELGWAFPWQYGPSDDPLYARSFSLESSKSLFDKVRRFTIRFLRERFSPAAWFRVVSTLFLHPYFFARPGMAYLPELTWYGRGLSALTASCEFDLLIVDHEQVGEHLPARRNIPAILVMHNLPSVLFERAGSALTLTTLDCWLAARQAKRILRHENTMMKRTDLTIFVSEEDEQYARRNNPQLNSAVVPNGVDIDYFAPDPSAIVEPNKLIFVGTLDYFPNVDAVRYITTQLLPYLRQSLRDIRIEVIGSGAPPADLKPLLDIEGLSFSGRVDDIRPNIASSLAFIAPLRVGSGTRLKILTAMAMGTPVISTRVGAEGLNVTNFENILLAETPEQYLEAVALLQNDPALRRRLSEAGRRLVESQYDWQVIGSLFESVCRKVVNQYQSRLPNA